LTGATHIATGRSGDGGDLFAEAGLGDVQVVDGSRFAGKQDGRHDVLLHFPPSLLAHLQFYRASRDKLGSANNRLSGTCVHGSIRYQYFALVVQITWG